MGVKWLFLALLIFVVACGQPAVICNDPYILNGNECCLDSNTNQVCDQDEGVVFGEQRECPEVDCSQCEAQVVTRNVTQTVTKYVCPDGGVAETQEACLEKEANAFSGYTPATGNMNGSVVTEFAARAACQDGYNAMEVHWKLGSVSESIQIQVKETPSDSWETVYEYTDPTFQKYVYGALCQGYCTTNANFYLSPGKVYLVRVTFDYTELYGKTIRSDELLVDITDDGDYLQKLC